MWKPTDDFVVRLDDKTGENRTEQQLHKMVEEIRTIVNIYDFDLSQYRGWEDMKNSAIKEISLKKEEIKMQDYYKCICGSVEWIISNNCVECASCGFKYTIFAIIPADDFNKRIRKGLEKDLRKRN